MKILRPLTLMLTLLPLTGTAQLAEEGLTVSADGLYKVAPNIPMNGPKCKAFTDFITGKEQISYTSNGQTKTMTPKNLGFLVVKDGQVVFRFEDPKIFDPSLQTQKRLRLFSISKSLTGLALARILSLQYENNPNLKDTPIFKLVPEFVTSKDGQFVEDLISADDVAKYNLASSGQRMRWRRQVTLMHTWNYGVGNQWCEYGSCASYDYGQMTSTKNRADTLAYVVSKPMISKPGSRFGYSAGNYTLMTAAIRGLLKKQPLFIDGQRVTYENMFDQLLFKKMGINRSDYFFEKDGKGLYLAGSGLSMNLDAFAKLGQLVMQNGKWRNADGHLETLIRPEIMNIIKTPAEALYSKKTPQRIRNWEGTVYHSFWGNLHPSKEEIATAKNGGRPISHPFMPNISGELIYAGGNFGQFLYMFPKSKLMVVRMGADSFHSPLWSSTFQRAAECLAPEKIRRCKNSGDQDCVTETQTPVVLNAEESYQRPKDAVTEPPAPSDLGYAERTSWFQASVVVNNILINSVAKELCTCYFVNRYQSSVEGKKLSDCEKVFPFRGREEVKKLASYGLTINTNLQDNKNPGPRQSKLKTVTAQLSLYPFAHAVAQYHPASNRCKMLRMERPNGSDLALTGWTPEALTETLAQMLDEGPRGTTPNISEKNDKKGRSSD